MPGLIRPLFHWYDKRLLPANEGAPLLRDFGEACHYEVKLCELVALSARERQWVTI